MKKEHDKNQTAVDRAYRDLATEKAPAELDARILARASAEARTRYGLARMWSRPIAWAAMIGLSLAIVLEVAEYSRTPETQPPAKSLELIPDEAKSDDEGVMRRKRQDQRRMTQPAATSAVARDALEPSPEIDMPAAREANDVSYFQEAEQQTEAGAPAARSMMAPAAAKEERIWHCDADARRTAASWYECIDDLRDEGSPAAAASELEALRAAFPDFRPPGTE